ncbi:MAG: zinc ribbon domain-containing protein [Hyphomicrobiaceae bacterium]|nr:MAG: zinc ribbon domain-containing protein [Hyphomicrobiaceae bacterium]
MPTYDYRCPRCGSTASVIQSMSEYTRQPKRPVCCADVMERRLSVVPAFSGLANALAGDRHYDGLRAPDGTDISSRTKHREYMARTGLTATSDFKDQWAVAAKERADYRQGTFQDAELREEVARQVHTAVAKTE